MKNACILSLQQSVMPETGSTTCVRKGSGQPPAVLGLEVDSVVRASSGAEVEVQKDTELCDIRGSI